MEVHRTFGVSIETSKFQTQKRIRVGARLPYWQDGHRLRVLGGPCWASMVHDVAVPFLLAHFCTLQNAISGLLKENTFNLRSNFVHTYKNICKWVLVLGVMLSATNSNLFGVTLEVGKSGYTYNTIQDALNAAASGDTVLVHPGTYPEHIILSGGKDVYLKSSDGPFATIIDANGAERTIERTSAGDGNATIEGFKITGASDKAVYLEHDSQTILITNCVFEDNAQAIWVLEDYNCLRIINNQFIGGKAIYVYHDVKQVETTIKNNLFNGCSHGIDDIAMDDDSPISIIDNIFVENGTAIFGGWIEPGHQGMNAPRTYNYNLMYNNVYDVHPVGAGVPGPNNVYADPCFVDGPLGEYYLSQIAAGQDIDSPAVDAGSESAHESGMDEYTTRIDDTNDTGIVDIGYHYQTTGNLATGDLAMQADPISGGTTTPSLGTQNVFLYIPIDIQAHPEDGYAFDKWIVVPYENASVEDPCDITTTITLVGDATVTAIFVTSILSADIDNDGDTDFLDFALLAAQWGQEDCNLSNNWCDSTDLDQSGTVDFNDLAMLAGNWLNGTLLNEGLAYYYSYEESTNTNGLIDLVAGKNSSLMWGSPVVESNGIINYGWAFDGDDAISWDDPLLPDLEEGDNFTLSVWGYNTGLTNNNDGIWSTYHTGATDSCFLLDIYESGLRFIGVNMGLADNYEADIVPVLPNQWYHYVWRKNGTEYTIFINGTEVFSTTGNDAITWDKATSRCFIIGSQDSAAPGNYWWNGYFDEFGVWLRSLTDEEIIELYNDGEGLSYNDIVGIE